MDQAICGDPLQDAGYSDHVTMWGPVNSGQRPKNQPVRGEAFDLAVTVAVRCVLHGFIGESDPSYDEGDVLLSHHLQDGTKRRA